MLGSSLSASFSNTVISTIVADALKDIADRLENFKYLQDVRDEALKIIQEICVNIIESCLVEMAIQMNG